MACFASGRCRGPRAAAAPPRPAHPSDFPCRQELLLIPYLLYSIDYCLASDLETKSHFSPHALHLPAHRPPQRLQVAPSIVARVPADVVAFVMDLLLIEIYNLGRWKRVVLKLHPKIRCSFLLTKEVGNVLGLLLSDDLEGVHRVSPRIDAARGRREANHAVVRGRARLPSAP